MLPPTVRPSNGTFPGVAELDISRAFPVVLYQILYHQLLVGRATDQYSIGPDGTGQADEQHPLLVRIVRLIGSIEAASFDVDYLCCPRNQMGRVTSCAVPADNLAWSFTREVPKP